MANKYVIGFLVLVILTSSVYVLLPDNVRIDVGKTYSTFKVWENDSWVLAGKEYSLMFDGTKKMRANSRTIEQFIDGEDIKIVRTSNFKNNVTVIDTYTFNGNESDIELFPISHNINVLNGEGYILVYEVTKLEYSGETVKDINSPQEFGHQMKIEWENGNYYSRIWKYSNRDEGKLTIKYRLDSENFTKKVRLFDPPKKERYTPSHVIGEKCYSSYDSINKIMTDTSCLQFKTETNGVITVNDERYLSFALKGTINGNEIIKTSMDFNWVWYMNESDGDYIFWAENDNPDFIWRQYYYFYEDYSKPMKIEHYLENNLADIKDMQMYYLMNILPDDEIEYNETKYLVSDYMGLHKKGNFNNLIPRINFNSVYEFNFEDIVNDGFTINEFYIGSGSVIGKPNLNITAVGFTKNNGNFPKGSSVLVDPTFTTEDVRAISMTPLDEDTFVMAWCDDVDSHVEFIIYNTNGTAEVAQVLVDEISGVYGCNYQQIAVSALNSTAFVIFWFDGQVTDDLLFKIYNSDGTLLVGPITVDASAGDYSYFNSVSAFNSTTFVVGFYDRGEQDTSFRIYNSAGTALTNTIDIDTVAGTGSSIAVAALNETAFAVINSNDINPEEVNVSIYSSSGALLVGPVEAFPDAGVNTGISSITTLTEDLFVAAWFDGNDEDVTFSIYDSSLTLLAGPIDADITVRFDGYMTSLAALNSESFVMSWFDSVDDDATFSTYTSDGTLLAGPIDSTIDSTGWSGVTSYLSAIDIGLCNNNFIHAYSISTSLSNWTAYYPNGTVWDGTCIPAETTIVDPTTISPKTVSSGDNITVSYNYSFDGSNVTFGVGIKEILIEGEECVVPSEDFEAGTFFNDTFTDSNGIEIDSHIPTPTGTGWTLVYQDGGTAVDAEIISNQAQPDGDDTSDGFIYMINDVIPTANYEVSFKGVGIDASDDSISLIVRYIDNSNFYAARILTTRSGDAYCNLYKYVGGVRTVLDGCIITPADGEIFQFVVEGDNLNVYADGDLLLTAVDSDLTEAGRAGFGMGYIGSGYTADDVDASEMIIDDFNVVTPAYTISEEWDDGINLYANCSVPVLDDGLKDLYIGVNYFPSKTRTSLQIEAINYADAPPEDSCTYTSGDWNVDCNDNCSITSNVNLGGNNLIFSNPGIFWLKANIINYGGLTLSSGCNIVFDDTKQLISS